MLQTAQSVYDRAKTQIGKLARRAERSLLTPSEADEDVLKMYLEDALTEIGTETDRLSTSVKLTTTKGQPYVDQPPHLDVVRQASIYQSSTAYEVEVWDGSEIAQWSRDPAADSGRPDRMGAHEQRLYLYPVPDAAYTIDLQITMNGATSDNGSSPSTPSEPPELDTVVAAVPAEFDRALAAHLVGRWFADIGEMELAAEPLETFRIKVEQYNDEPAAQATATRDYNVLG